MFFKPYRRLDKKHETPVIKHQGVFRRQITLIEGIAFMSAMGAGVLGIPYAVVKVGIGIGLVYIVGLGFLMMGFNLLIGEIAVRTKRELQLVGLAEVYLGKAGKLVMMALVYIMLFGVLMIYIIGEGEVLSALLGGSSFFWSLLFFSFVTLCILAGVRTVKKTELLMGLGMLLAVILLSAVSARHVNLDSLRSFNLAQFLFPYGVILFSLHASNAVPEVYSILEHRQVSFKRAIVIGDLIVITVYAMFALVSVGVMGSETTEIATIGLGQKLGHTVFILGNIFAAFSMGTAFLTNGLSLRDSMRWDFHLPTWMAAVFVCGVPLTLFLWGIREFILAIDIVGGVFISLEMLLTLLIYWKAKQRGDLTSGRYKLHHTSLLVILLLLALSVGVVYSVVKLF